MNIKKKRVTTLYALVLSISILSCGCQYINDSKNELIRLKDINLKTKEERWLKPLNRAFFIYNDKMYYVIQNGIYL